MSFGLKGNITFLTDNYQLMKKVQSYIVNKYFGEQPVVRSLIRLVNWAGITLNVGVLIGRNTN